MKKLTELAILTIVPLSLATGCPSDDGGDTGAEETETETTAGPSSTTDAPDTENPESTETPDTDTESESDTDTDTDTTGEAECAVPAECTLEAPCELGGAIDGEALELEAGGIYVLTEPLVLTGVEFTVPAGVTIYGADETFIAADNGSTVTITGTEDCPVVFTSGAESPARGDWGGLLVVGNAPTNREAPGTVEGIAVDPFPYGDGTEADSSCGTFEYLRLEYCGNTLEIGDELNCLSLYACGSGTTISHVQASIGQDDGFEFFGGNLDADHLIVYGTGDDALDTDFGYQGTLQHVFVQYESGIGNYAAEWANSPDDSEAEPRALPVLLNATVVGTPDGKEAQHADFKQGTGAQIVKSIFVNFPEAGNFNLRDDSTVAVFLDGGDSAIANNIFDVEAFAVGEDVTLATADDFIAWTTDNQIADPELASIEWGSPDIVPGIDVATENDLGGTRYIGAVDPEGDNWTLEPWTNYDL